MPLFYLKSIFFIIRQFLNWWVFQLKTFIPKQILFFLKNKEENIVTIDEGKNLSLNIDLNSNKKNKFATLLLDAGKKHAAFFKIQLPRNFGYNVRSIIYYEIDKYTPFKIADDVYFEIVDQKIIDKNLFNINVVVVSKSRLNSILDDSRSFGININKVDIIDSYGCRMGINLLPKEKNNRPGFLSSSTKLLVIFSFLILYTSVIFFIDKKYQLIDEMGYKLQKIKNEARYVASLQSDISSLLTVKTILLLKKKEGILTVNLISDLSQCVPSSTWIEQLELKDKKISLTGQSTETGVLIDKLKHCQLLENPQVQGSIQSDSTSGKERFNINLNIKNK